MVIPFNDIFNKAFNLKKLILRRVGIVDVPHGVFRDNLNLEVIDLSDNGIKSLHFSLLEKLTKLEIIKKL